MTSGWAGSRGQPMSSRLDFLPPHHLSCVLRVDLSQVESYYVVALSGETHIFGNTSALNGYSRRCLDWIVLDRCGSRAHSRHNHWPGKWNVLIGGAWVPCPFHICYTKKQERLEKETQYFTFEHQSNWNDSF